MSESERAAWLAGLKPGDLVAINTRTFGESNVWVVRKVVGRSAKWIDVAAKWIDVPAPNSTNRYRADTGEEPRRRGDAWTRRETIEPVTDEIRAAIRRRRLLRAIVAIDWTRVSTDRLERVEAIVKEQP